MMISLLYSSGLRLSEVLHLQVKDIDIHEKIITVRGGNGNKYRITVLSEKIISDLSVFLEDRKPNDLVFVSNQKSNIGKDRPLTSKSLENVLQKALVRAKISKSGKPQLYAGGWKYYNLSHSGSFPFFVTLAKTFFIPDSILSLLLF